MTPTPKAITGSVSVAMNNGNLIRPSMTFIFSFTQQGQGLLDQPIQISPSSATVIPLGNLVSPGLLYLRNMSTANGCTYGVKNCVRMVGATLTNGNASVSVPDTAGLVAGMTLSGPGVFAGATVSSITDGTHFVMSHTATANYPGTIGATGTVTLMNCSTASSTTITCASTKGLFAGMSITGYGIPGATTISSITDATHFIISAAATHTIGGLTLSATTALTTVATTRWSNNVSCASTASLAVGTVISGTGIQVGSTVASIVDGLNFTLNLPALLTQPQTTIYAYGSHMVPMGECGPGGFGMMILTDGAVPMALARDAAVEIQAWIAEG